MVWLRMRLHTSGISSEVLIAAAPSASADITRAVRWLSVYKRAFKTATLA